MTFFLDHTLLFLLPVGWAVVPVSIMGKQLGKTAPMTFEPKCLPWVWVRCLPNEVGWRGQVDVTVQTGPLTIAVPVGTLGGGPRGAFSNPLGSGLCLNAWGGQQRVVSCSPLPRKEG